jgi:hypothetical protein
MRIAVIVLNAASRTSVCVTRDRYRCFSITTALFVWFLQTYYKPTPRDRSPLQEIESFRKMAITTVAIES